MTKDKRRNIMNAFFSSQFAYCSLVWMFQNRTLNNRINKLQEQALRLVHIPFFSTSFFNKKTKKKTVHLQSLSKYSETSFRNELSIVYLQKLMLELFNEASVPYNLRQDVSFRSYNVKTIIWY